MEAYDILRDRLVTVDAAIATAQVDSPCILEIPHAGTLIPEELRSKYVVDERWLRDADLFTDELYELRGSHIVARLNRYVLNMNRPREGERDVTEYKHEDALHTFLQRMDLSLQEELSGSERSWLLGIYDEYHDRVHEYVQEAVDRHGAALLLACHSMNATSGDNTPDEGVRPGITLGTHERSIAGGAIIDALHSSLSRHGYDVVIDHPYSGGITVQQYEHSPKVHAVQVEVNKQLYMDEETFERKDFLSELRCHLRDATTSALEHL